MRRREFREQLVELLARAWPIEDPEEDDDGELARLLDEEQAGPGPDQAIPVNVLLVVDWQGSDGERWLSYHGALGNGDEAPVWIATMLANEVVEWDEADEAEP